MAFRPRMQAQTRAYRTLRPLCVRTWPGVVADVWHVESGAGAGGFYLSPDPRLVVLLGTPPHSLSLKTSETGAFVSPVSMVYVPAGQPLWSAMGAGERFSHLDLHLEAGPLQQRLAGLIPPGKLSETVILAGDADAPGARTLARMVADEVERPSRPTMMLDGLLSAMLAEVLNLSSEGAEHSGGLSPRQIAAVKRHVADAFPRRVSVAELAQLCGLSESWFSRAFARSTGETPQRWIARHRLEAAMELMLTTDRGLADIADATGFADQAHLTRIFRASQGLPPSQWRRMRVGQD
jgi:AraC family transcriptional regulator